MKHYSVLLRETLDNLNIVEDGVYVDATLGYGGHSKNILKRVKRGFLFAFDQDEEACAYSQELLSSLGHNFKIFHSNFENMKELLNKEGITKVDGIIFDLGLSSPQIDETKRGFSFQSDARLDMRMDPTRSFSALNVVNDYSLEKLTDIFYKYAEEKMSKVIASTIIKNRPINTTFELVDVIKKAVGLKYYNLYHPERTIFQAIRIEVNEELRVLERVLPDAISLLKPKGRICVITFHSLEDKIVKQVFKKYSEVSDIVKGLPSIPKEYQPLISIINKKVILPSEEEIQENTRSKSAKLRVVERNEQ